MGRFFGLTDFTYSSSTLSSERPSMNLTSSVDDSSADAEKRAESVFEKEGELEAQHTEF